MTYHVLTILTAGVRLSVQRGFLVCKLPDDTEKRLPLDDIRALVMAHPQASFSQAAIARLLSREIIVLHCDEQFKPIGWTAPLHRAVRRTVLEGQLTASPEEAQTLWKIIVGQKMANQAAVLDQLGIEHRLHELIKRPLPSEANIARQYWQKFFTEGLDHPTIRERRGASNVPNQALNYGYAVLLSLVHRSILIHGLLPAQGIHHQARFRSTPLVYDLMEPLRPFIDLMLVQFTQHASDQSFEDAQFMSEWIVYCTNGLRMLRLADPKKRHTYKLMDAVGHYVNSVARSFESRNKDSLWLPAIGDHYLWRDSLPEEDDTDEEQVQNGMAFSDV